MIRLDFYLGMGLFFSIFVIFIFSLWISEKGKEKQFSLDKRFIWFCEICAYTYVNTKEDKFSICPRCGSYNKKQDGI